MTSIVNFIDSFFESIFTVIEWCVEVALFTFIVGAAANLIADAIIEFSGNWDKTKNNDDRNTFLFVMAAIVVVAYKVYWLFQPAN